MPTNVPGTKENNKNKPNKEPYYYTPLYQADFIIGSCSSSPGGKGDHVGLSLIHI